jgi:5-methylcytosine-specific restriction endonuclease McrA
MATFRNQIRKLIQEFKQVIDTRPARIAFLIRWSKVACRTWTATAERREKFNRHKKSKRLLKKGAKCWVCKRQDKLVRHHMIQLQHGGENWKQNLVVICEGCHAEVHPWMDATAHPVVAEANSMEAFRF